MRIPFLCYQVVIDIDENPHDQQPGLHKALRVSPFTFFHFKDPQLDDIPYYVADEELSESIVTEMPESFKNSDSENGISSTCGSHIGRGYLGNGRIVKMSRQKCGIENEPFTRPERYLNDWMGKSYTFGEPGK